MDTAVCTSGVSCTAIVCPLGDGGTQETDYSEIQETETCEIQETETSEIQETEGS